MLGSVTGMSLVHISKMIMNFSENSMMNSLMKSISLLNVSVHFE